MDTLASCDARISFLEQEIARFTKELHNLKVARNARAPLVRLPDELLIRIAKHAIPNTDDYEYEDQRKIYTYTWICHRLRCVIISAPQLWTTIDIAQWTPRGITECLERAAACPLNIRATGEYALSPPESVALINCLRKAGSFSFSFMGEDFNDQLAVHNIMAGIPAPKLLSLSISHAHPARLLFAVLKCPNLVSLVIEEIEQADDLPAYMPALRSLRLRQTWYTAKQIYQFLLRAQQLERVYLEYVMDDTFLDHVDVPGQALQLPGLTDLTIHETEDCAVALVQMFPNPSASFKVHVQPEGADGRYEWTSSGPTAGILSRMEGLWKKRTDPRNTSVDGLLTYAAGDCNPMTVRLQTESTTYMETGGIVTEADPCLAIIKTLHIIVPVDRFDQGLARMAVDVNLRHLPKLECVVIEQSWKPNSRFLDGVGNEEGIRSLEAWISRLHQEGHPLQTIQFIRCGDAPKPLFDRLTASQTAHSITWSDERMA
jgi:hypothetical protein